ncbi:MAG: TolC family protein [Marinilabiliales bacterium]|nr:MAG: TolC family protein [Marinilabiliales bacterium]
MLLSLLGFIILIFSLNIAVTSGNSIGVDCRPLSDEYYAGHNEHAGADDADILDYYIRHGLENNLALQQKRENYKLSLELLNEARGLFYPALSFNMRYTLARGGRVIELPVGDLLNPVYSTLNMLTGTADFPDIDNEYFYFYRPREQETKFRVVQPLVNPEIWYNRRIREHETEIGHIDVEIYRRALVAEIKKAYFNYLKSGKVERIIEETIELLNENLRVTGLLAANDMVTDDYLYRSQAEISAALQQRADAAGKRKTAAAWFNFLLNRSADTPIEMSALYYRDLVIKPQAERMSGAEDREELARTGRMIDLASDYERLVQSNRYPRLTAVVEYGLLGTTYSFGRDDDFMLASIVLSWPLFEGFQNRASIQQAKIRSNIAGLIHRETEEKLNLQVINAWYDLEASAKAVDAAEARLKSATSAFRITEKRYAAGEAQLIEYIDARTGMTNAEINLAICRYEFFSGYAEYERVAALYVFE